MSNNNIIEDQPLLNLKYTFRNNLLSIIPYDDAILCLLIRLTMEMGRWSTYAGACSTLNVSHLSNW